MAVSWRLVVTSVIVAFGSSFQSGYFVSLYNVPQDIIEQYINTSVHTRWHRHLGQVEISTIWAMIASTNQAGKVIACFLAPIMADRIGRKGTILLCSVFSLMGIVLQSVAQPTGLFLLLAAGRFVSGLYNGVIGVVVPLYLVEIAITPNWRGGVTRIHNVVTILGNILALLFGLPQILGTPDRWGYLALVPLPLVIVEVVWLFMVPESPMYMMQRGRSEEEVKKSLKYYLGDTHELIEPTLNDKGFQKRLRSSQKHDDWWATFKDTCKNPVLRNMCILWFMLSAASSFSGGAITNNYLTAMISGESKFSDFDRYSSVVVNSVKILVVLAALYVIDRVGRKPLLLMAMWSVLCCLIVLAGIAFAQNDFLLITRKSATWSRIVFLFVWTSVSYVVNSTATLVVSETALQKSRALSLGMYKTAYHLISVFLTLAFLPISKYSEGGSYLFLAIPYFFICVYVSCSCPETKSVNLLENEIEKIPLLNSERKISGAGMNPAYEFKEKTLDPDKASRESLTEPSIGTAIKKQSKNDIDGS